MDRGWTLAVAPGDGLLCVRGSELVFTPTGDEDVAAAFRAGQGPVLTTLTALAEERGAEMAAFVAIDWTAGLRIVVFGDVEVTSDHRSMPRLSAAEAGTWVERSVDADGPVTLGVAQAATDGLTALEAGVVRAGGFALTRHLSAPGGAPLPALPPTEPMPQIDPNLAATPAAPIPTEVSPDSVVDDLLAAAEERVEAGQPPLPSMPGRSPAPAQPPAPPPVSPVLEGPPPDDPPPDSGPFHASPDDETMPRTPAMVDAMAALLPPEEPVLPPEPHLQLIFQSGQVEVVDSRLILGRSPKVGDHDPPDSRPVRLDDPRVSGTHLRVDPGPGGVVVTDLGSTNGSFMLATGDGEPFQLRPDVGQTAAIGAVVQIGTQRFWVRAADQPAG